MRENTVGLEAVGAAEQGVSLRAFTYSECSCGIADVMRNTFVIWQVRHGCKKIWQPTCIANIPPVIFFKILTNNIIC